MVPSKTSFLMLYILRISPLEGICWTSGWWLCRWGLQTLTLFKTKTSHFTTLFVRQKTIFDDPHWSIFIFHTELSNKGHTHTKNEKWKQDWLMIFFKCLLVVRTCRRRIADVYPLFNAFRLQKFHVQDAWNCITCLRIKASKTLPLSLSQNQIRLRALVRFM